MPPVNPDLTAPIHVTSLLVNKDIPNRIAKPIKIPLQNAFKKNLITSHSIVNYTMNATAITSVTNPTPTKIPDTKACKIFFF